MFIADESTHNPVLHPKSTTLSISSSTKVAEIFFMYPRSRNSPSPRTSVIGDNQIHTRKVFLSSSKTPSLPNTSGPTNQFSLLHVVLTVSIRCRANACRCLSDVFGALLCQHNPWMHTTPPETLAPSFRPSY